MNNEKKKFPFIKKISSFEKNEVVIIISQIQIISSISISQLKK